jgi:glutathione S-transferase
MPSPSPPILYSNDSCPYAFRARCALHYAGIEVEHREIAFDNKPPSMLEASPKGTVPTMVLADGRVIDESWDVMRWAVSIKDPDNWAGENNGSLTLANGLVQQNDGEFSYYTYYFQYASNYPERSHLEDRNKTMAFASQLEHLLAHSRYLDGDTLTIGDVAVFPFVRSLSAADLKWFSGNYAQLQRWVDDLGASQLVKAVSVSHPLWEF